MHKISITGTKGKTTVVNITAQVLQAMNHNVLHVDTTGHFVNGERRSTLEESKEIWGLVPTVCPGRYLWEVKQDKSLENGVAVLECAVGSSAISGLGYRAHEVGVFLNVFEDHLGSSERLKSRRDIAEAKSFIFSRLQTEGYAVFNADDELVVQQLSVISPHLGATLVPCGLEFKYFDVAAHVKSGGSYITVEGENVVLKNMSDTVVICDLTKMPWTFNGHYQPSVYNTMFVAASILSFYKLQVPENLRSALEASRLDKYGGRLTVLKAENGAQIIADYAHEKVSLGTIGTLAHELVKPGGKVIGVVRLAHDRTDELLQETGHIIAESFDYVIVYDKIDGFLRKPRNVRSKKFPQIIGKTSEIIATAVKEKNRNCERIIREDEAIARAAELAGPEDVVVSIVNDEIERSIEFIKASFKAEFV